ncbi:hypothetical protein F5883DRAFT_115306 [Diaporthe sp. PMI_573]|nr:hypothetical protein F5883DRAFT_115306 [Diaporthaceae sp. PMI_573]
MIDSAMALVLLDGRSFTAAVPLAQPFHDHMLLATISRPVIGHSPFLCISQPPNTTSPEAEMRLWAAWPNPDAAVTSRQRHRGGYKESQPHPSPGP